MTKKNQTYKKNANCLKKLKKKIFEKLNDQRTLLQLITLVDMSKITNEKKYNLLLLLHLLYFSSNAFKYFFFLPLSFYAYLLVLEILQK